MLFILYRSIESNIYNLAYFWKMPGFFYLEFEKKCPYLQSVNHKIKSQISNIHGKDLMSGDNTADFNFFGDEQVSSGSSST